MSIKSIFIYFGAMGKDVAKCVMIVVVVQHDGRWFSTGVEVSIFHLFKGSCMLWTWTSLNVITRETVA